MFRSSKTGSRMNTPDKSSTHSTPAKLNNSLKKKTPKSKSEKSTPSRIQPMRQKDVSFSQAWRETFEKSARLVMVSVFWTVP